MRIAQLLNPEPPAENQDDQPGEGTSARLSAPLRIPGTTTRHYDRSAVMRIRFLCSPHYTTRHDAVSRDADDSLSASASSAYRQPREHDQADLDKSARVAELDAIRRQAHAGPRLDPTTEIALAAYLLCRERSGSSSEDISLTRMRRLRAANQTVEAIRNAFPWGRGNVRQDVAASSGLAIVLTTVANRVLERYAPKLLAVAETVLPSGRIRISPQQLAKARQIAVIAAIAETMEAGVCTEYAALAAIFHARHMQGNDTLEVLGAKDQDHSWARTDDVLMDAWSQGPAIFEEDSMLGSEPAQPPVSQPRVLRYAGQSGSDGGPKLYVRMDTTLASLLPNAYVAVKNTIAADAKIIDFMNREVHEKLKVLKALSPANRSTLNDRLWDQQSVFSREFYRKAIQTLREHSPQRLGQLARYGGLSREQAEKKLDLNAEIAAVKVARRLGADVREATRIAPQIVQQAKRFHGT